MQLIGVAPMRCNVSDLLLMSLPFRTLHQDTFTQLHPRILAYLFLLTAPGTISNYSEVAGVLIIVMWSVTGYRAFKSIGFCFNGINLHLWRQTGAIRDRGRLVVHTGSNASVSILVVATASSSCLHPDFNTVVDLVPLMV